MSKGVQIALGAGVCALLLGWYANSALQEGASFTYYQNLDELRAAANSAAKRPARVHGYVALGSIDRDVPAKTVRFELQADPPHAVGRTDGVLPVEYESLEVPDLFKDGAEVVIEGRLSRSGAGEVFRATNVLAKCPSKFETDAEALAPL